MKNPIVNKFLENGLMEVKGDTIELDFSLYNRIRKSMDENKMSAEFHFNKENGALVFDKILGRDVNNDFYNENNINLEQRKKDIKEVIVTVLLTEYNS